MERLEVAIVGAGLSVAKVLMSGKREEDFGFRKGGKNRSKICAKV